MMSLTTHAKIKSSKSLSSGCQLSTLGLGRHLSLVRRVGQVCFHCFPFSEASNISGCQRQAMRLDGPLVCSALTYPEP